MAALGDVVASWPSPERFPLGLACGPKPSQMWVYCNEWPCYVYHVNADTGSVYGSFLHYQAQNKVRGLSFSYGSPAPYTGSYLWVGDVENRCVYMSDPATGRVNASYSTSFAPDGLAVEATGDGGRAPTAVFTNENVKTDVWRLQLTTGSVMSSFSIASQYMHDIAYDWRTGLVWATWGREGVVAGCDPATGSIVASFTPPPGFPVSFTYSGEYLWIGTSRDYHRVYKVHCPGDIAVAPASLGRVKALFR